MSDKLAGENFAETLTPAALLTRLLRVIDGLKAGLGSLPDPENPDYYPRLLAVLAGHLPRLYAAYDAVVTSVLITEGRSVTCSKGCSACCRHFVSSVEPFEILALDAHLKSRGDYAGLLHASHCRELVYDEIVKREGEGEEASDRALYRYFLRGIPCPFLEADGSCGVYAWRPMACRMFFAESPPRFCAGKSLASPWNKNFQVELPHEAEEALARCSRMLEHLKLPEDLFPGLVAANAAFGRYEAEGFPSRPPSGSPAA
jgi:Fe-S-cluster containining protein